MRREVVLLDDLGFLPAAFLPLNPLRLKVTMTASATVRDLRTRFPAIKTLLRKEGRVTITDHGKAVAVLTLAPGDEHDPERIRLRKQLKAALKDCDPAEFDRPLPDEFQGMCG